MTVKKGISKAAAARAETLRKKAEEREELKLRMDEFFGYETLPVNAYLDDSDSYYGTSVEVDITVRECSRCSAIVFGNLESLEKHFTWHLYVNQH